MSFPEKTANRTENRTKNSTAHNTARHIHTHISVVSVCAAHVKGTLRRYFWLLVLIFSYKTKSGSKRKEILCKFIVLSLLLLNRFYSAFWILYTFVCLTIYTFGNLFAQTHAALQFSPISQIFVGQKNLKCKRKQ